MNFIQGKIPHLETLHFTQQRCNTLLVEFVDAANVVLNNGEELGPRVGLRALHAERRRRVRTRRAIRAIDVRRCIVVDQQVIVKRSILGAWQRHCGRDDKSVQRKTETKKSERKP